MFIHTRISAKRDLPSLDGKLERFVLKNMEKAIAKLESDKLL